MGRINVVNNVPGIKVEVNGGAGGCYLISITKENQQKLGDIDCGHVVKFGDREFIVLDQLGDRTAVITKDIVVEMNFGGRGDWSESPIRSYLNTKFLDELIASVGNDGVVKHLTDGMADDGTGRNLSIEDSISLLTCDEYRKYREYLPAYGTSWWLASRVTRENKAYARYVCRVHSDGYISWHGDNSFHGVRPFCFLKSDIMVDA